MCEEGLHDTFTDQVECARYRAERDMLAQAMERVADDIERTFLGFEGAEDAPAMRWAREFRSALGSLHAPVRGTTMSAHDLLPEEEREAIAWMRDHGGLDAVRGRLGERKRLVDLCRAYEDALDMMADSMDVEKSSDKVVQARRTRKAIKKLDRRLMPEGMEWPKVDGKPVDFVTVYEPSLGVLEAVSIYSNGAYEVMSHDGIIKEVKGIHIEKPEVYDADGVEIREGDTVWNINTGDELVVDGFDGRFIETHHLGGEPVTIISRRYLTHTKPEPPDSWERLEEDVTLSVERYRERYGIKRHDGMTWPQLVRMDLVRRAKALAERGK